MPCSPGEPYYHGKILKPTLMDGRTDGWTDGQKISPFYRTSSPIGAAALPPPMKIKEKVEQGKETVDHFMPLGYLLFLRFFVSLFLRPLPSWLGFHTTIGLQTL